MPGTQPSTCIYPCSVGLAKLATTLGIACSILSIAPMAAEAVSFRSIDGSDNNLANPELGSTDTQLLRLAPSDYGDNISTPAGADRPDARTISNGIVAQSAAIFNSAHASDFLFNWGQFIDHDLDLTPGHSGEEFYIIIPQGDPAFDPFFTGVNTMPLERSIFDPTTGTNVSNPRQQINQITAWIDASNVYGSNQERADALRTFSGGKLKTSAGDLLPFNTNGLANENSDQPGLFLAGDVRANEQIGLIALHTLFVREHNRLADEIGQANPEFTDDQIYEHARAIVGGQLQAITYNEFLPVLLGEEAIPDYNGYNPNVDPTIANEFSTAAFRLGHTLVNSTVLLLDENGNTIPEGNLELREAFFNPTPMIEQGLEPVFRGLAAQKSQELDPFLVDDLRNFLFGPPGTGGLDLASLNIQRGRDHGLSSYNDTRYALGLDRISSFAELSSDLEIQQLFASVYDSVDDIDLWIGGLAEDHINGGMVGETFSAIVGDQFTRLRDGDRFYFKNSDWFSDNLIDEIEHTSLADVIRRNTDVTNIQDNVFIVADAKKSVPEPGTAIGLLTLALFGAKGIATGSITKRSQQANTPTNT